MAAGTSSTCCLAFSQYYRQHGGGQRLSLLLLKPAVVNRRSMSHAIRRVNVTRLNINTTVLWIDGHTFLACSCRYLIWSAITVSLLQALALTKSSPWETSTSLQEEKRSCELDNLTKHASPSALARQELPGPWGPPLCWSDRSWPVPFHWGPGWSQPGSLQHTWQGYIMTVTESGKSLILWVSFCKCN